MTSGSAGVGTVRDERTRMSPEHNAIAERLQNAQEIIEKSGVHPDFRIVAFAEVFRALAGASTKTERTDRQRRPPALDHAKLSDRLAAVADAFEVDPSMIQQVFADDDEQLIIVVPARRFEGS